MTDEKPLDRSKLTFAQAEGVEPLPQPLKLKEVSRQLRALLWEIFYESLWDSTKFADEFDDTPSHVVDPWFQILRDLHIYEHHKMVDDFSNDFDDTKMQLRAVFKDGNYISIFGFIQFVLRYPTCPEGLARDVTSALQESRAAYTVVEGNTICPVSSPQEGEALERAFAELAKHELNGAREHLRLAAEHLTLGKDADSIRESINAVESVARILDPGASKTLGPALAALEKGTAIHSALRSGFSAIYGYTNNAQGIRHPLLDNEKAPVESEDALFMIGACASFITYLIAKARRAGIELTKEKGS